MKVLPYLLWLLVLPAAAQDFDFSKLSEMLDDPEKMQQEAEKMAKSIAEAQSCMNSEDFKKMQAEGQAIGEKIDALCAKGDRKGAEKAALEYSTRLLASREFKALQKCSEQFMATLPQPFIEAGNTAVEKDSNSEPPPHICDM